MRRSPGETVVVHEVWRERVWSTRPMTAVQDEDDLVALWFPEGTTFTRAIPPPARAIVERGVFDDELAARLRHAGMSVLQRAQRNEPPFDEPWPGWRPDPEWTKPVLPSGCETLCR